MDLSELLVKEHIKVNLESDTKDGIIGEMVDMMVRSGSIKDRAAALNAIVERERKMSTGMQQGIAIPHGKTDRVDSLVSAVGLKKGGVDFASLDGQPSRIFVMTVSPTDYAGPHIQFLAEISRLLNDPGVRERLLRAESAEEVIRILTV